MKETVNVRRGQQGAPATSKDAPVAYVPPVLTEIGSLEELTGTGGTDKSDGGEFQFSGIAG